MVYLSSPFLYRKCANDAFSFSSDDSFVSTCCPFLSAVTAVELLAYSIILLVCSLFFPHPANINIENINNNAIVFFINVFFQYFILNIIAEYL